MKFTLSWLKEHLDTKASLGEVALKLTTLGLEVEKVEDRAALFSAFRTARVLRASPHPQADKLQICEVDTGDGKIVQVVCGASNAREGLIGVFAPEGASVPGTGLVLKRTKIRGVESCGMLVSERELGLSDEHEGIIELDPKTPIGKPFAQVSGLDDAVIDIAVTPNRPDCLGVHGIARDLAAGGIGKLHADNIGNIKGKFASPVAIGLHFSADTQSACPIFAGRLVRNVKNGPSPEWLQARLKAVGLRPINALVDITNYICIDCARPLHVYDARKISGEIHARLAKPGESLKALDDKSYALDEGMCVIADSTGVLGLGGVMGGHASGVGNDTTDVFIESAYFDPRRTAATGRKLSIDSDARYRFERGVDPASVLPGLELATKMILELCGGEASEVVVAGKVPSNSPVISFNPALVARLLGLDVSDKQATLRLQSLGFDVKPAKGWLNVTPPSFRPDIEGPADLVEEIARLEGLDAIPAIALPAKTKGVVGVSLNARQTRLRQARRAAAARGLIEAVTWSFVSSSQAKLFGGGDEALKLANPISSELSDMRPSLLAGLITAASRNSARGFSDVALFEAGPIFSGLKPENQTIAIAGVRSGTARPAGAGRHWQNAGGQSSGAQVGVFDVKADALAILAEAGAPVDSLTVTADAPGWYHPGRSGSLRLGPKSVLATFGEIHPQVLRALDAQGPIVAFEIMLDALPEPKRKATRAKPALKLSGLMPLTRDFAFVVDKSVSADALIRAAKGAERALISDVVLFDVFEGKGLSEGKELGEDKKSLALSVTINPEDKTLTDEDIEALSQKIIAAIIKATGAVLRA